jgi:hypothetical protein
MYARPVYPRSTRAKHAAITPIPVPIRHGGPRLFLTAPLSSAAVGFHQDQGEQLRCYGKLTTSSQGA